MFGLTGLKHTDARRINVGVVDVNVLVDKIRNRPDNNKTGVFFLDSVCGIATKRCSRGQVVSVPSRCNGIFVRLCW